MTEAEDSAETPRKRPKPGERRLQILQAIAAMLEEGEAERVTTAALAARLQVSEAASTDTLRARPKCTRACWSSSSRPSSASLIRSTPRLRPHSEGAGHCEHAAGLRGEESGHDTGAHR